MPYLNFQYVTTICVFTQVIKNHIKRYFFNNVCLKLGFYHLTLYPPIFCDAILQASNIIF